MTTAYYPQQPSCQIRELWFLFEHFLGSREEGAFVEVGAHDGVFVSNSWGLAERGWRGLLVEPVPSLAELCAANHEAHPGVKVIQTAVGGVGTESIRLNLAGTLTTANEALHQEYARVAWAAGELTLDTIDVECTTLDVLLETEAYPEEFDVLVVDVEGFEREVFSGFTINRWRPKMLIVELVDTHPDLSATAASDAQLGMELVVSGYVVAYKDSVNTVFVREDVWSRSYH